MHDFIVYLWDIHERFIVQHYKTFDIHALYDKQEVFDSTRLFPYLE